MELPFCQMLPMMLRIVLIGIRLFEEEVIDKIWEHLQVALNVGVISDYVMD